MYVRQKQQHITLYVHIFLLNEMTEEQRTENVILKKMNQRAFRRINHDSRSELNSFATRGLFCDLDLLELISIKSPDVSISQLCDRGRGG